MELTIRLERSATAVLRTGRTTARDRRTRSPGDLLLKDCADAGLRDLGIARVDSGLPA